MNLKTFEKEESVKERRVRWLLLLIVLFVVLIAFYFQSLKFSQGNLSKVEKYETLVTVVNKISEENNPIVAVVDLHSNAPFLNLYEINVNDRYKFESIKTIELEDNPTDIVAEENSGVWLKIDGEWWFFDEELQSRPKKFEEIIVKNQPVQFDLSKEEDFFVVTVNSKGNRLWSDSFQTQPLSIHSLSKNDDIWLLVFEDEVVIYES